ncbi:MULTISPECIES: hypothetical protein [Streptomyces]|uniref:DUF2634 domain-containing protein n=1 Tax=Streptomyces venezuelae TaxID=54571 RepID=A0A5P2B3C9_STRVZ|nr:hypothetical protein [Streptomyces venezuelae]QES24248.1 hypothetical protein DEJ46_38415 [Streptomyces venezuelae]
MPSPAPLEPLGHSLLLDDGDLVVRGGGLAEVRGLANLVQALTLRLLTPYGSDRCDHRYGLSAGAAFTHPGGSRVLKDLLRLEIVRTLAADPRVREVAEVTFTEDPAVRVLTVRVLVEALDGRTTALTAEVEV